jgi:ADP-ribose pyrophosphatase YjhB (NUDIX family)
MKESLKELLARLDPESSHQLCFQCHSSQVQVVVETGKELYACNLCGYKGGRQILVTPDLRYDFTPEGLWRHFSVGGVIERNGRYLLFNRRKYPFQYTLPAGHWNWQEADPQDALVREVYEETGLRVITAKLLYQEDVLGDTCRRGSDIHYWHLYRCICEGEPRTDEDEGDFISWYTPEQIRQLELTTPTRYFLMKLRILT